MEYIAQYETTKQISPDDWKVCRPALKIDDNTTIGEIRKWVTEQQQIAPGRKWRMEVSILELDHIG